MKNLFEIIGSWISTVIDFFYPPFSKYMTLQFFRYGVSGAANLVFNWILYFLVYNFVLQKQMLHLGIVTLSSHIAAFGITFFVTFFSGFLLQKYVTFTESDLRGRVQLIRYLFVVTINLVVNYLGLKLLVDVFLFYPTLSNMAISIFTTFISYFSQKKFTFKNSPQTT
ncbi:MAG: GtrA family protein [Paludibacter sp.]